MKQTSCFCIQRGDESPEELQGFAKTWCAKYSVVHTANVPFPVCFSFFSPTFSSSILSAMWPTREAKPRFGAVLVLSVHEVKLTYSVT